MSILFLASDASEFAGVWVNTSTSGEFDSSYTDKAFGFTFGSQSQPPFPAAFSHDVPSGDFWLHYRLKLGASIGPPNGSIGGSVIDFINSNGQTLASLESRGTTQSPGNGWRATVYGDTTVSGSIFALPAGATSTFDFQLTVNSTNIILNVYNNGSLVSTATAANSTGLKGKPRICSLTHDNPGYRSSGTTLFSFSEMVATDGESTIGWRIAALKPAGNGANTAWAGTYTDITTAGDGTMISDASVGDKETWTLSSYGGASSPASIRGLVTKYMAAKGTTGPQNIEPIVRLSSTDYFKSPVSPDNIKAIYTDWTVNPATSAAWATSDLTSIEVGVRSAT